MRKICTALATLAIAGTTVFTAVPAHAAPGDLAIGLLSADIYILTPAVAVETQNVTVEGLADSRLVGTVALFETTDAARGCLNGSTLNVFVAPAEFGNHYVIHNGLQGPQCTYGTWVIEVPPVL